MQWCRSELTINIINGSPTKQTLHGRSIRHKTPTDKTLYCPSSPALVCPSAHAIYTFNPSSGVARKGATGWGHVPSNICECFFLSPINLRFYLLLVCVSLSLGAVSNSDVGGHGFPLFSVPCSFDDLDFTDFQQLAEAFHEVQPWSSSASLALNFPSDYDVLKSLLSHDMSQETHLPRSDSVHQFPLCSSSPQYLIICDMVLPRYV